MKKYTILILLVIIILTRYVLEYRKRSEYIHPKSGEMIVIPGFPIENYNGKTDLYTENFSYSSNIRIIRWSIPPSCIEYFYDLRITLPDCRNWTAGGKIVISGTIKRGIAANKFSEKGLINKVIYQKNTNNVSLNDRLFAFLNNLGFIFAQRKNLVFSKFSDVEGSVLSSLIFGQTASLLPSKIKDELKVAGLQHLVSVSSYSFGLTIELAFYFKKIFFEKKRFVEIITFLFMFTYVLLVGYPAVLQRVLIATGIDYLSARFFHRPILPLYRLLLSSLILLALEPFAFFDLGLEISVLASLGIQLFSRPPKLLFQFTSFIPKPIQIKIVGTLWLSIVAQLLSVPLIFYYFGQLSLISPVSNLITSWTLSLLLPLGTFYWLVAQINRPLSYVFFFPTKFLTNLFLEELKFLDHLAFLLHFQPNESLTLLGYVLIIFMVIRFKFKGFHHYRQSFLGTLNR